eukprot:scaffold21065_cov57-Attheya_sp.AAC.4
MEGEFPPFHKEALSASYGYNGGSPSSGELSVKTPNSRRGASVASCSVSLAWVVVKEKKLAGN